MNQVTDPFSDETIGKPVKVHSSDSVCTSCEG